MVYLISTYCEKYYKIGHAGSVEERIKGFRTASPLKLKIVSCTETGFIKDYKLEKWLHGNFINDYLYGEWFFNKSENIDNIKIQFEDFVSKNASDLVFVSDTQISLINLNMAEYYDTKYCLMFEHAKNHQSCTT